MKLTNPKKIKKLSLASACLLTALLSASPAGAVKFEAYGTEGANYGAARSPVSFSGTISAATSGLTQSQTLASAALVAGSYIPLPGVGPGYQVLTISFQSTPSTCHLFYSPDGVMLFERPDAKLYNEELDTTGAISTSAAYSYTIPVAPGTYYLICTSYGSSKFVATLSAGDGAGVNPAGWSSGSSGPAANVNVTNASIPATQSGTWAQQLIDGVGAVNKLTINSSGQALTLSTLTGTLPAFASTPAFSISGTLPAFASTPAFSISGTLPAFTSNPTVINSPTHTAATHTWPSMTTGTSTTLLASGTYNYVEIVNYSNTPVSINLTGATISSILSGTGNAAYVLNANGGHWNSPPGWVFTGAVTGYQASGGTVANVLVTSG